MARGPTEPDVSAGSAAPASRLELETELARAREALDQARVRSEGFANLSHEIRTLLNGVIGITGLLLDTSLSGEQRDLAKRIRSSGDALLGLLNNVLDFSKVEANMLAIDDVAFEPRRTVEEVGELLAERAHSRGLELVTWVDASVPPTLRGDPTRLRQVLLNLVSNAIKFTEAGEVVVRATCQHATPTTAPVRFEVKDTGVGISEEAQRRLFQPFSQVHAGQAQGGTGLGLALAKRLVEAMGGEAGVTSQPGAGSTFWLEVPFARPARTEGRASIPRVDLAGRRVLVVDDSASSRGALRAMIEELDVETAAVGDARSALEAIAEHGVAGQTFDVVLLDLKLADAALVVERVRADGVSRILGLRAAGPRDAVEGLDVALSKPVRRAQLHAALRTLMGGAIERVEARAAFGAPPERAEPAAPSTDWRENVMSMLRTLGTGTPGQHRVGRAPSAIVTAVEGEDLRPRILLVEDNAVNQRVAVALVSKRGYRVDVAQNGFEAIEATTKQKYAAVLMDCQMPKLDGYATTQHIRKREGDGAHTPIVAMTANANPGDREKCLASGMDDYIAKPVVADELDRVLRQWAPLPAGVKVPTPRRRVSARPPRRDSKRPPPPAADAVDFAVLERLRTVQRAGEPDLIAEVIDLFLDELPRRVEALKAAAASGDRAALGRTAHTLKGSAGQIGATLLSTLCGRLEHDARAAPETFAPSDQIDAIHSESERVRGALGQRRSS